MAFSLLTLLLLVVSEGRVAADSSEPTADRTVAVVEVTLPPDLETNRADIEAALVRGLEAATLTVLPPAECRHRLAGHEQLTNCQEGSCLSELARVAGSPYIVRATIERADRREAITLDLVDITQEKQLAHESVRCRPRDPCPAVDIQITDLARELGRKGNKLLAAMPQPPSLPLPATGLAEAPAPPSAPTPDPTLTQTLTPAATVAPQHRRLPWLVGGTGLVLLATSGTLYLFDGHPTDCRHPGNDRTLPSRCFRLYDTRLAAAVTGAAGLAFVAAGAIWHFLSPKTASDVSFDGRGVVGTF